MKMKMNKKITFITLLFLAISTQSWALSDSLEQDNESNFYIEKLPNSEEVVTLSSLDEKQTRTIGLIKIVGSLANEHFKKESDKENALYAYSGFIARFQAVREDREVLQRKELAINNKDLLDYSKRLDRLISDIQIFFKS